jgi:hypothetical protein
MKSSSSNTNVQIAEQQPEWFPFFEAAMLIGRQNR